MPRPAAELGVNLVDGVGRCPHRIRNSRSAIAAGGCAQRRNLPTNPTCAGWPRGRVLASSSREPVRGQPAAEPPCRDLILGDQCRRNAGRDRSSRTGSGFSSSSNGAADQRLRPSPSRCACPLEYVSNATVRRLGMSRALASTLYILKRARLDALRRKPQNPRPVSILGKSGPAPGQVETDPPCASLPGACAADV